MRRLIVEQAGLIFEALGKESEAGANGFADRLRVRFESSRHKPANVLPPEVLDGD